MVGSRPPTISLRRFLLLFAALSAVFAIASCYLRAVRERDLQAAVIERLLNECRSTNRERVDPLLPYCEIIAADHGLKIQISACESFLAPLCPGGLREAVGIDVIQGNSGQCGGRANFEAKVRDIVKLRSLASVQLDWSEMKEDEVLLLCRLPRLSRLALGARTITDGMLESVAKIHTLRELELSADSVDDSGFRHLSEVQALNELTITRAAVMGDGLASVPRLKKVSLIGCQLSPDAQRSLGKCAGLHDLSIVNSPLPVVAASALRSTPSLSSIKLHNSSLSNESLAILASSRSIERLAITGRHRITPAGLATLQRSNLVQLTLWAHSMHDGAISALGELRGLRELEILSLEINEVDLEAFLQMTHLNRLTLVHMPLTQEQLERLRAGLPNAQISLITHGSVNAAARGNRAPNAGKQ